MVVDDGLLTEATRAHPEIYNKNHAGFKNPAIKEAAWALIGETVDALPKECSARWQTLRERYNKEKRKMELASRSGSGASGPEWVHYKAMEFLDPFIRKRKSVDNFNRSTQKTMVIEVPDESELSLTEESSGRESSPFHMLVYEDSDSPITQDSALPTLSQNPASSQASATSQATTTSQASGTPNTASRSSSVSHAGKTGPIGNSRIPASAASLPYLGSTGRCKKKKSDDDVSSIFSQALSNLNKSIAEEAEEKRQRAEEKRQRAEARAQKTEARAQKNQSLDPDHIIATNVEATLNCLPMALKLTFRRRFKLLCQEAEEAAFTYEQGNISES